MKNVIYLIENIEHNTKEKQKTLFWEGVSIELANTFFDNRKNKKILKEKVLNLKEDDNHFQEAITLARKRLPSDLWKKIKENRIVANFKPDNFKDNEIIEISKHPKLYLLKCSHHTEYSQLFSLSEWLENDDTREYIPRELEPVGLRANDFVSLYSLNVGQGNSTLVYESINNSCRFIDFGGSLNFSPQAVGLYRCAKSRDNDLEIFITHFDEDHVRFINNLLPNEMSGQVLVGPVQLRNSGRIITWIINWLNNGLRLLLIPNVQIQINITPVLELRRVMISTLSLSPNETGIAYSIDKNNFKCLFPGDAKYTNVQVAFPENNYNFLYVSHHGSRYSIPTQYDAVKPAIAPISHGGRYGHPHQDSLDDHGRHGWNTFELINILLHYTKIRSNNNYYTIQI